MEEASGPKPVPWADNETPVGVFTAMGTQWRESRNGLDYGPMTDVMRMLSVPRCEWGDVFASVQVMEAAAMSLMAAQREVAQRK